MIDRRSFLIGAGSILTVPFIDKAEWFLRNRNAVVLLIEPMEQTTELFFVRLVASLLSKIKCGGANS